MNSAVSKKARISEGVLIGHYCVIEDDVEIGAGTVIKNFVELRNGTKIGRHCYIDSGVKCSGEAEIGDSVTVRYDSIIARGCKIGDGTYLSPQAMFQNVDHQMKSVGGAKIGKNCFIGTNVTFNAGITVADEVVIGSKSLVTKSLEESRWVYIGIPAKKFRKVEA